MNRLDKFVNDKLAQRAFEMDKNHWLQAAQLIDAQQKRRRRFFWIWFLSGQVLVLVLAFFLWPTFVAEKTATRSNLSPPLVQTNATAHPPSLVDKGELSETADAITSEENVHTTVLKQTTKTSQGNTTKPFEFAQSNTDAEEKISEKELIDTNADIPEMQKNEGGTHESTQEVIVSDEELLLRSFKASDVIDQPEQTIPVPYKTTSTILPLLDFNVSGEKRKMDYAQKAIDQSPFFNHEFSLVLASTLYPYAGTAEKNFIGFVAGVNYTKSLKRSLNLNFGLNYRKRFGTFSEASASEQTTYAFSRSAERFYTLPENMHFLEIPVAIQYVKNRHALSLGFNGSYLLGLRGTLHKESYGESFSENGETQVLKRGWLRNSGVKPLHWDIFASWNLAVTHGMSVGVQVNYSVGTILKNPNSGIYLESKPVFFDVGLRYNLIKK